MLQWGKASLGHAPHPPRRGALEREAGCPVPCFLAFGLGSWSSTFRLCEVDAFHGTQLPAWERVKAAEKLLNRAEAQGFLERKQCRKARIRSRVSLYLPKSLWADASSHRERPYGAHFGEPEPPNSLSEMPTKVGN
jgi:hypothetical protein